MYIYILYTLVDHGSMIKMNMSLIFYNSIDQYIYIYNTKYNQIYKRTVFYRSVLSVPFVVSKKDQASLHA